MDAPEWETTPAGKRRLTGVNYFEGCLPIEEIARRGRDTLRFGPMKPVGLRDPRSGKIPYAVVQLRQENLRADSYNLVGFQNHLRFGEQARVLRLIPGLENARFLRYGQIHRNTYINAPTLLLPDPADEAAPARAVRRADLRVEGYVESIATGQLAGIAAAALAAGAGNRWRRRAQPPWARWCTTSAMPKPATFSRPTSLSTCCSRSTKPRGERFATRRCATGWCASTRWRHWKSG